MDPTAALTGLLSLPFLILCLVIGLFVAGFRKVVESGAKKILAPIVPDKYEPVWVWVWREVILPVAPLFFGGILAIFASDYPYPPPFDSSLSGKVFISIVAGLGSGFLYPRVKFYFNKWLPKKVNETAEKIEEMKEEPKE